MDSNRIEQALIGAVEIIRNYAPYDTGNLSLNAIKFERISTGEYRIYIDEGDGNPKSKGAGIAPYIKYTNEPWSLFQPPLLGKQNPNEGWWDMAVDAAVQYLATELNGEVKIEK